MTGAMPGPVPVVVTSIVSRTMAAVVNGRMVLAASPIITMKTIAMAEMIALRYAIRITVQRAAGITMRSAILLTTEEGRFSYRPSRFNQLRFVFLRHYFGCDNALLIIVLLNEILCMGAPHGFAFEDCQADGP
jgi:hypothetical protein